MNCHPIFLIFKINNRYRRKTENEMEYGLRKKMAKNGRIEKYLALLLDF